MILCANPKEQYLAYKDEINQSIERVLNSGWYILGQEVKSFENEFALFCETKHAVGVANGTDAIFLALKVLDIGSGDEVITVSHTAMATASAIESSGADIVFVDIEDNYFTIDASLIEKSITSKTKAIVAVHLYGQPCNMDAILSIAKKYDLDVIEDCAQAHGARYKGKVVGSMGDVGCFSFFPTKNLGAIGDGGAVVTNRNDLSEKLSMIRQYGWDNTRQSHLPGYNSRLDELQAAVLRVKLKYLHRDIEKRNHIAQMYEKLLATLLSIRLPVVRQSCSHAFHLYVISLENRDEVLIKLKERGIIAMIHYAEAVHQTERFATKEDLSITEKSVNNILSLPLYPELSYEQIKQVCDALIDIMKEVENVK